MIANLQTNLRRLVRWLHLRFRLIKADDVPFSEVPIGEVFWWRGECYIKEDEHYIFSEAPMRRPFPWREMVSVYPPNDQAKTLR